MSQLSFLAIGQTGKQLKCERFLDEMHRVIPWSRLCQVIAPYYQPAKTGRPLKALELMVKIHCLQQWYHLSDPGVEEAIYDRNSFQKFLRLDLIADDVPDETTMLHFRHLLEAHDLASQLFATINDHLAAKGLLMKEGTIVDATLIAAASSTKNANKKRDPEMSSTKKNDQWHFGMKAHIGVDAQGGLVHAMAASTAKVHDRRELAGLLHGAEKAIFGDKGYYDDTAKRTARDQGIFWGVLDKGRRAHPLSHAQQKWNRKMSAIRSKVEHPFQVIKCQWGYVKARYRGITKNAGQLYLLFGLYNLFKVRRVLLAS